MARDRFHGEQSIISSADDAVPAVKGTPFAAGKGLYVGTGGDLLLVMMNGQTRTFKNVPSGAELNVRATQVVNDAACTADDVLVYY